MTEENRHVSRRTVVKGAAWSIPVIAAAVATPLASASGDTAVNDFSITGNCGLAGLLGAGFDVTATAASPIPAGTVINLTSSGALTLQAVNFSLDSSLASVASLSLLSPTSLRIFFDHPFSGSASLTSLITVSVLGNIVATAQLPSGYAVGTNAKPTGGLTYERDLLGVLGCEAS